MAEEVEKVKKRVNKRLEQSNSPKNGEVPFNDVIDHMRQIEGFQLKTFRRSIYIVYHYPSVFSDIC
jgi:hypothetical protein